MTNDIAQDQSMSQVGTSLDDFVASIQSEFLAVPPMTKEEWLSKPEADEQPKTLWPTQEDAEFAHLCKRVGDGSGIYNLLSKVHTDENGKKHIPFGLAKNPQREIEKMVAGTARHMVELAFSSSPEDPWIKGEGYDADQARLKARKRAVNRHQKYAAVLKGVLTREIMRRYPVKDLLAYNPLREQGAESEFCSWYENKAKGFLSDMLRMRDRKSAPTRNPKRAYKTKKYQRDSQSLGRPRLNASTVFRVNVPEMCDDERWCVQNLPGGDFYFGNDVGGHAEEWAHVEERYARKDIAEFSRRQGVMKTAATRAEIMAKIMGSAASARAQVAKLRARYKDGIPTDRY